MSKISHHSSLTLYTSLSLPHESPSSLHAPPPFFYVYGFTSTSPSSSFSSSTSSPPPTPLPPPLPPADSSQNLAYHFFEWPCFYVLQKPNSPSRTQRLLVYRKNCFPIPIPKPRAGKTCLIYSSEKLNKIGSECHFHFLRNQILFFYSFPSRLQGMSVEVKILQEVYLRGFVFSHAKHLYL